MRIRVDRLNFIFWIFLGGIIGLITALAFAVKSLLTPRVGGKKELSATWSEL